MGQYYVYELAYPELMGGEVFYIVKGKNNRINEHEQEARRGIQSEKCDVIRFIWSEGKQIVKRKTQENMEESEAYTLEIALIKTHGRQKLTNKSNGGSGVSNKGTGRSSTLYLSSEEEQILREILINDGVTPSKKEIDKYARHLFKLEIIKMYNFYEFMKKTKSRTKNT